MIKPDYKIEVVGARREVGQRSSMILDRKDVEWARDELEVGKIMRWQKIVATVEVDEQVELALYASGLQVRPSGNIIDAVSANTPTNKQAIVITTAAYVKKQRSIIDAMGKDLWIILYDDETGIYELMRQCREKIGMRIALAQNP